MSDEREEQEPKRKFKVVDRRRFDADGEMRDGAAEVEEAPARAQAPTPAATAPAAAAPAAPPPHDEMKPATVDSALLLACFRPLGLDNKQRKEERHAVIQSVQKGATKDGSIKHVRVLFVC